MDLTQYCKKENIAFSEEEKRFYELNHQKVNYSFWRDYVNKFYENNVPEEAELFIRSLQEDESFMAAFAAAAATSPHSPSPVRPKLADETPDQTTSFSPHRIAGFGQLTRNLQINTEGRSVARGTDKSQIEFPSLNSNRSRRNEQEEEPDRKRRLWSEEQRGKQRRVMEDKLLKKMEDPIRVAGSKPKKSALKVPYS